MRKDLRSGGEAARKLAQGVPLRDAVEVTSPGAWLDLDAGTRCWLGGSPRVRLRLRAAVGVLDDPDDKPRAWAGQSVQGWFPSADVRLGDPEVGDLLDRARHLFSDYVLRQRKRLAGLSG